ncbi:MAG: transposase [Nitrososphaera sp.]|nr:transposase [Nitrososphaera sp.]
MSLLNFKMRLYPTESQERHLEETLEVNRIVYNYFVVNNFRSRNDMNYALTELKEQQPLLRQYHAKMLQMISTKVAGAQSSLDELKKRGHEAGNGELQLLRLGECNSFVYNQTGYRIEQLPEGNRSLLHLSKIGSIEMRVHRRLYDIAQVTVLKQAGRWYAILACKVMRRKQCSLEYEKTVGIDVGVKNYVHDSDGNHVDNPLFLSKESKPLHRAQRKVSRRKKGSRNYKKAVSWLQRLHRRIANKRRDFLHKLSNYYSERYDAIFLEKLKLQNMNKNHCLARHIMDSSWGMFKQLLQYKANRIVDIDPYHTSVDCSKCGNKVPKKLAIRIHECDVCGAVLDRDHNSSMVIEDRGRMLLGLPMRHREVTPVETLIRVVEAGTGPHPSGVGS